MKLLPYILVEKYTNILPLEKASPGNRHCACCIGALSFPIHSMRPIVTDARVVCVSIRLSVCLLIATVSCAETAEPIKMPFSQGMDSGGPGPNESSCSIEVRTPSQKGRIIRWFSFPSQNAWIIQRAVDILNLIR